MSRLNDQHVFRWFAPCVVILAVTVLEPVSVWAQGCAMCRTLVGGPGDPLGHGINTSIMFLMAMPFAMTACVGAWIAYMYRRGGTRERTGVHPLAPRGEEAS